MVSVGGESALQSNAISRLPPIWPDFVSQTWRRMWDEFVGSLLCSERFFSLRTPVFLSSRKPMFDLLLGNLNFLSIY